jgi:hypothetical protein
MKAAPNLGLLWIISLALSPLGTQARAGSNTRGSFEREALGSLKVCSFFEGTGLQIFPGALMLPTTTPNHPFATHFVRTKVEIPEINYYPNKIDFEEALFDSTTCVTTLTNHLQQILPRQDFQPVIHKACARKPLDAFGLIQSKSGPLSFYRARKKEAGELLKNFAVVDLSGKTTPLGTNYRNFWRNLHKSLKSRVVDIGYYRAPKMLMRCLDSYFSFLIHANYHRARGVQSRMPQHANYISTALGKYHFQLFASQLYNLLELIGLIDLHHLEVVIHPIIMAELMESAETFLKYVDAAREGHSATDVWLSRLTNLVIECKKSTADPRKNGKVCKFTLNQSRMDYIDFVL